MGNTSSVITHNTNISFIIKSKILNQKDNKESRKNRDKILKKCKSQIKYMTEWGLSELGSNYENSINYYTSFKVKKIEIKRNGIHIRGVIKMKSGKRKNNRDRNTKKQMDITENQYKNHIKSEIVRASDVSIPISTKYDKNKYDIYFTSVENILYENKVVKNGQINYNYDVMVM